MAKAQVYMFRNITNWKYSTLHYSTSHSLYIIYVFIYIHIYIYIYITCLYIYIYYSTLHCTTSQYITMFIYIYDITLFNIILYYHMFYIVLLCAILYYYVLLQLISNIISIHISFTIMYSLYSNTIMIMYYKSCTYQT